MLAVLIVIAVVAFIAVFVTAGLGRQRRFNEVDRFHRASQMTSAWARNGVTTPVIASDEEPREARTPRSPRTK